MAPVSQSIIGCRTAKPLSRDWRIFTSHEADAIDADEMDATDISACREHCERYGLGGFVIHEGRAYFRWESAESLDKRKRTAPGCSLHLGFAWQDKQSLTAALRDEEGLPATVGESRGHWLDPRHLLLATAEGTSAGVAVGANLGVHGPPRGWPQVLTESPVLKGLLKKSGPCAAIRMSMVPALPQEHRDVLEKVQVSLLRSFDNAIAVQAATGMHIVKGWAVYDLYGEPEGTVYVAEAYWWNSTEQGQQAQWLDFTPHPENSPDLLLVESAEPAEPAMHPLTLEQLILAEGLLCLRFPCHTLSASVETGTEDSVSLALRHARGDSGGTICCGMVNAGMCGAVLEHLSVQGNRVAAAQLLALLTRWLQANKVNVKEELWAPLQSFDVMWELVRMMGEEMAVALPAASTLTRLCCMCSDCKKLAHNTGAAQAFVTFFDRDDLDQAEAGALLALWEQQFQGEQVQQPRRGRRSIQHDNSDWQTLHGRCHGELRERHMAEGPLERRAKSWARTLAYAQVALGHEGVSLQRGTQERPFVIWVLGAEDMVEGYLAEDGYFQDANFVERAPTEVVIVGSRLRELVPSRAPKEGQPPAVRTTSWEVLPWSLRLGAPLPDLLAVLTPEVHADGVDLQDEILDMVPTVPAIISTRRRLSEPAALDLKRMTKGQFITWNVKNPFSSGAASSGSASKTTHEDNLCLLGVRGGPALGRALELLAKEEVQSQRAPLQHPGMRQPLSCVFWGILDIKYDKSRPLLERVKVLETGDGDLSKFSGAGADVKKRFDEGYALTKGGMDLHMFKVVSSDKKWTHDRMEEAGYGHIVPKQVCFPRTYEPDLAERILAELDVEGSSYVVLKLCNRARAAGVVVTPADELDEVLEALLVPPKDLETWLEEALERMNVSCRDLGCKYSSFQEQQRHWWSNECPVFVAETWCGSTPLPQDDGSTVDATLRVGFALRLNQQSSNLSAELQPEDLQVDWLGGYWKCSLSVGTLRQRIVSAARTAGTKEVCESVLKDVYTALGDSVQHLFSGREPSSAELCAQYSDRPELAAYFAARLGASHRTRDSSKAKQLLTAAESTAGTARKETGKYVLSYIHRARGVLEACGGSQPYQIEPFQNSLTAFATNANANYYLGVVKLQEKSFKDAKEYLQCSLLLDPDHKAPYINLGMVYLNLGLWKAAVEISLAGRERFPSPHLEYHLGLAYYQLAVLSRRSFKHQQYCHDALTFLKKARESSEAAKPKKTAQSPWHEADSKMISSLSADGPVQDVPWPDVLGWHFISIRLM